MFTTRIVALVVAALGLVSVPGCGRTVHPGEAGLKYRAFRNPALQQKVLEPGYYALWGWNRVIIYDVTAQNKNEDIHTLTKDNLHVPTTVTVTFHPLKSELLNLHTEVGPEYYDKLVGPAFITLVRAEFAKHLHNNLARESPIIEQSVLENLRELMAPHHIGVDRVAIRHIDYDQTVTAAISRKVATVQQAEQKKFEVEIASRDAEIARTTAQGHSDAVRIQAEGDAAAVVLRGKAQAEAQDAVTKTLTRSYLQYKAFDNPNASYVFVPTGRDGLPVIFDAGSRRMR